MNMPAHEPCPNCVALGQRTAALEQCIAALNQRIIDLQAELAKAQQHSANSSKPPSRDLVKPPRQDSAKGRQRRRGGQPGHPRHERPPFAPQDIDEQVDYRLAVCPDCGGKTTPLDAAPSAPTLKGSAPSPVAVTVKPLASRIAYGIRRN
jgi:transposase